MLKKRLFKGSIRQYGMIFALALITILFQILTGGAILRSMNLSNLILQNSYIIILSVGMFFCILTGNVDLSVGSVLGFCGAVLGELVVKMKVNPVAAILIVLLLGLAIGAFQGTFIAFFNVAPFIATLAGSLVFRGLTLFLLQGHSISPFPQEIQFIASGFVLGNIKVGDFNVFSVLFGLVICAALIFSEIRSYNNRKKYNLELPSIPATICKLVVIIAVLAFIILEISSYRGVPLVLLIILGIVLIYNFVAGQTVTGRHIYALGGNQKAAKLSGIKTKKLMFLVYVNSAFLAAIGSVIVSARLNAASTSAGTGFELDAIAACYIGGCACSGGEGTILGVIIGALVMGILNNGMAIMGIGSDIQNVVKGLILLLAVTFDVYSKSKAGKRA